MFRYLLCASAVSAAHLYGFIDAFINKDTQTAYQLVDIDTKTGVVTELVQTFVFNGGSASIDGIACLNRKASTYYWANDGATSFIYSVLATTKSILPTFDSGATAVESLACNQGNGDVWVSWALESTSSTATSPTTTQPKFSFGLTQFKSTWEMGVTISPPPTANMGMVSGVAVNGQTLYLIAATSATNISDPELNVWTFNTKTGAILSTQPVNCPVLIQSASLASSTSIRGGGVVINAQATAEINVVYDIDPTTGDCLWSPVAGTDDAIITGHTYNPGRQELYMSAVTDSGMQILTYAYATNQTTAVATNQVFLNIQYSSE